MLLHNLHNAVLPPGGGIVNYKFTVTSTFTAFIQAFIQSDNLNNLKQLMVKELALGPNRENLVNVGLDLATF